MSSASISGSNALVELGVREDTLSAEQRCALDSQGFLLFPSVLSHAETAALREAADSVYATESTGREGGPAECSYMQNKAPGLDACLINPQVLAAVTHVLQGEIKSFGIHGRPHPPGGERQALHVDYNGPAPLPGAYAVCNSVWMLVDFTLGNGATRIVPGSHLMGRSAKDGLADPMAIHQDEVQVCGAAGSVAVFNSHVWHGTSENRSGETRHSLTSFYCRRDDPHMVFKSALSLGASERLGPAARWLFADPEPFEQSEQP